METTEFYLFRYSWFEVWDCPKEGTVLQTTSGFTVVLVCKPMHHEIFLVLFNQGGPCGVLAAVQACVLQKLLFEESSNDSLVE